MQNCMQLNSKELLLIDTLGEDVCEVKNTDWVITVGVSGQCEWTQVNPVCHGWIDTAIRSSKAMN